MVEIGSLQIGGSINTEDIERGTERINKSFDDVGTKSKSVNSDFVRMSGLTRSLALTLAGMATAGAAALTAMATTAPAVAPALAKMNIEWTKMSHSLGRDLAPIFNEIAYTLLPAVGEALDALPLEQWAENAAEDIRDIAGALQGNVESIQNLIPEASMMAAGAAAGFALLGPAGLFIGAAVGYAAGEAMEPRNITPEMKEEYGVWAESVGAAREQIGYLEEAGFSIFVNPFEKHRFAALTARAGVVGLTDLLQYLYGAYNKKEMDFATKEGTHYD